MITARLHGRLGNQMFQYAAARGLAARLGTNVALDTREATRRGEGVLTRVFNLPLVDADALPPDRKSNPAGYYLWRYTRQAPRFRRERGLSYNVSVEEWDDGSYLHGYWQSERYFQHISDQIRADFLFPGFSTPQNAEMADRIGQEQSVSMHVRRGDYTTLNAHVLCDQSYYEAALERISKDLQGDITVFVFSDEPQWAKENLPLPCKKVVVDFNGPETDFEDMRLMSLCKHNIIGNSSFSWWAAWLNANPSKQVAGPDRWFGNPKLVNPDILPPGWLRISA